MPSKQKTGRQTKRPQSQDRTSSSREQDLEALVLELQKELRIKEGVHQEQLRNANTVIDANHYYEVMDKVEQLQEEIERLKVKPNEAPENLDSQDQGQVVTELHHPSEPTIVLPKELKPSRNGHILQLIDQHSRRKEELLQRKGRIAEASQETSVAIDMTKRRIREIRGQARLARSEGVESTQGQMFPGFHGPKDISTCEQSPERSAHPHASLEPPSLDAYPVLTSNHHKTQAKLSLPTPPTMYSDVGHNASQMLKIIRYKSVSGSEKDNETNVTDTAIQDNEDEHD